MRVLTYTNQRTGDTIELGTNLFPITSLEGVSTPDTDVQSQKSPFQDGSNYIDTLLQEREITVEGAINTPKDMPEFVMQRRAMLEVLNPKDGEGLLVYQFDGGSRQIYGLPTVVFSNKEGTDPFTRYQVNFVCHSPFWENVAETTASLPYVTVASAFNNVVMARGTYPNEITSFNMLTLANTNLAFVFAYKTGASTWDIKIKKSTDSGVTWGADVTIQSGNYFTPVLVQAANGDLFCYYGDGSNDTLKYKKSTDNGATWGAIQSVSLGFGTVYAYGLSGTVLTNNDIIITCGFKDGANVTYAASIESTDNGATYSNVVQISRNIPSKRSGISIQVDANKMVVGYIKTGTTEAYISWANLVSANLDVYYGNETKLSIPVYGLAQAKFTGTKSSIFVRSSRYTFRYLIDVDNSEILGPIIATTGNNEVNGTIAEGGNIAVSYASTTAYNIVTAGNPATVDAIGTVYHRKFTLPTPLTVTNNSDIDIPVVVTTSGIYPALINETTGESIGFGIFSYNSIDYQVLTQKPLHIDTTQTKKKFAIQAYTGSSFLTNALALMHTGSIFLKLKPGANILYLYQAETSEPVRVLKYRERYIGV